MLIRPWEKPETMTLPECYWEYYQAQQQRIESNYLRAAKQNEVEGVHDLRVDIKRLRAYFALIEAINPVFSAKPYLKPIRRLFKSAGPLRDIHVQQELVRISSAKLDLELSEYYNYLKTKEIAARKAFSKEARTFDFKVFDVNWAKIRRALIYISGEYIQYKAEQKFDHLVTEVIAFKGKSNFLEEDYHAIRILAKAARYTLEILQLCYPPKPHWKDFNRLLRGLHQSLGRWHDGDVALQYLDGFLLAYTLPTLFSEESYARYALSIQEDKTAMLSQFEERWKGFLTFLENHDIVPQGIERNGEDQNQEPVQTGEGKDSQGRSGSIPGTGEES